MYVESSRASPATFTDLYELTMAQACWRSGRTATATFSLTFRGYPKNRGYYIAAGLSSVLGFLETFRFTDEDVIALDNLGTFDRRFLNFLSGLRFEGDARAMPEVSVCAPDCPVLEVTAPFIQGQLVETYLLNQVNLHTLLATKASRVVQAARGKTIVDFAARRAHGTDAADAFARDSYLVGFAGTSNVRAGSQDGIPLYGTMAHSFVTSYDSEADAFRAYAETFPSSTTLLVDTYSTQSGLHNAINVALEMKRRGHALRAVRLDSGDLAVLSRLARSLLDEAGLQDVRIFASGGLDEYSVADLLSTGAPIDGFGVGTRVGVSADAPWTDCAYKLVEYDGKPVMKLSTGKQTLPGPKQVYRTMAVQGTYAGDVIATAGEAPPEGAHPLLETVMKNGRRVRPDPGLHQLRERFQREFALLPEQHKLLESPVPYPSTPSKTLVGLTEKTAHHIRSKEALS